MPYQAKDEKIAYKTINARVESIDTSPSYREAVKKRRCLIPADGFYEWQKLGPNLKQPYSIGMADHSPFVFAGLWEGWKPPESDEWLRTCTIITCEANELCKEIRDRMPVILAPEHQDAWLKSQAGKQVLTAFPSEQMKVWPISSRVNSPKNNDPHLTDAV